MLTLCDRNFLSHRLARDVLATGAHILWRATASFNLNPVEVLPDGTYLAVLNPARTADGPPITVRVIEYTVHTSPADGGTEESSELLGRTGAPCQDRSWWFPRPARRTRRATLTAPGAPRVLPVGQPLAAAVGSGVHGVGILLPR